MNKAVLCGLMYVTIGLLGGYGMMGIRGALGLSASFGALYYGSVWVEHGHPFAERRVE